MTTPVITQRQYDPTVREFDNGGGQRTSSRWNIAEGLECSTRVKARDLMWAGIIFKNLYPDPITLTEESAGAGGMPRVNWAFLTLLILAHPLLSRYIPLN